DRLLGERDGAEPQFRADLVGDRAPRRQRRQGALRSVRQSAEGLLRQSARGRGGDRLPVGQDERDRGGRGRGAALRGGGRGRHQDRQGARERLRQDGGAGGADR